MGMLGGLFGRKSPQLEPAELGVLGCDVHSHFIPGIDDGAQNLEQSIEMIKAFMELGYRKVITTPHVMADGYRNTPEMILGGLEKVRAELKLQGMAMEIEAAAEYYLDHELEEKVMARTVLTFGKNYLLFELPFIAEPNMLHGLIFNMQTQGYKPVLAHPERYSYWHTAPEKLEALKDRGVIFQINMVALCGAYGPSVRKAAERMIDAGWVELLGSDCHNMNHVEAIKATLTAPYLHKLIASGKLLNAGL